MWLQQLWSCNNLGIQCDFLEICERPPPQPASGKCFACVQLAPLLMSNLCCCSQRQEAQQRAAGRRGALPVSQSSPRLAVTKGSPAQPCAAVPEALRCWAPVQPVLRSRVFGFGRPVTDVVLVQRLVAAHPRPGCAHPHHPRPPGHRPRQGHLPPVRPHVRPPSLRGSAMPCRQGLPCEPHGSGPDSCRVHSEGHAGATGTAC